MTFFFLKKFMRWVRQKISAENFVCLLIMRACLSKCDITVVVWETLRACEKDTWDWRQKVKSMHEWISQQHLDLSLPTFSLCTTNRVSVSLAFLCVCACSVTTSFLFVFVFTYALSCILYVLNCTILFPSMHSSVWYSLFTGHRLCFFHKILIQEITHWQNRHTRTEHAQNSNTVCCRGGDLGSTLG